MDAHLGSIDGLSCAGQKAGGEANCARSAPADEEDDAFVCVKVVNAVCAARARRSVAVGVARSLLVPSLRLRPADGSGRLGVPGLVFPRLGAGLCLRRRRDPVRPSCGG